jgi:glutathione peroxidase
LSVGNADRATNYNRNFTKFLVDKEGKVVARFSPNVKPASLKEAIEKLL